MRSATSKNLVWVAVAFVLLVPAPGRASTILVTSESGIAADGLIDWGVLGPNLTAVPQPFTIPVPGIGGLTTTVSKSADDFQRRDQGTLPLGWGGNFGLGEKVLWTGFGRDPDATFTFNMPIAGFGAQIDAGLFGAFTAHIEAFDSLDNSLGLFSEPGVGSSAGDDSAIFIGILSTSADISKIVIGVVRGDFAINGPRVQSTDTTPVPEPATLTLLGCGLVALSRRNRRR